MSSPRRLRPSSNNSATPSKSCRFQAATWLASDGHDVHLIDRVPRHVDQARRLAPGPGRVTAAVGDARDLAAARASFDAVLTLFSSLGERPPSSFGAAGQIVAQALVCNGTSRARWQELDEKQYRALVARQAWLDVVAR